ncbi:MAG: bifunctional YncE family protein/alkaline phosphatase family protein [Candidatus Eremiobacteraeota bacterium]|nr:bifunctional YncE family protein/alkaline phosphatase family protein [Candidatus Eremiobacteraeota bacterium]MBV9700750.1 bifunctional YncE family protein/alkaline phosphatase family protein [Candidatus Eremiobacteraeota bacterium]
MTARYRCIAALAVFFSIATAAALPTLGTVETIVVPNGWHIAKPQNLMRLTGTMPQGEAASPDAKEIAVVASGFNPPALEVYRARDLAQIASVPLKGAFGRPIWLDATHVLVAGANADAIFNVDTTTRIAAEIKLSKNTYPTAIAVSGGTFAVATDDDESVRIGTLETLASARPVRIGGHVGGLAFSSDGKTLFASNRSSNVVEAIDAQSLAARPIGTRLHPSDLLVRGNTLYVAESDDDTVGIYDTATGRTIQRIFVGDRTTGAQLIGASPNALAMRDQTLFVTLGAANSLAVIQNGRVTRRLPTGWYPTDVLPIGSRLFVLDGKGEGTRPNPNFNAKRRDFHDYVASIQYGSIRVIDTARDSLTNGNPLGVPGWRNDPPQTLLRKGGPIRHVFFILKENRSYDQVLGDVAGANGDKRLTWFDARVTPNQHALAERFGIFDNMYASGEVSESGHNWADAAFDNDYVERVWPMTYGDRGSLIDDSLSGEGAPLSHNGYIWQEARAAGISFRDYGELTDTPNLANTGRSSAPSLEGLYDPQYVGWNLDYSDFDRVKEWRREFNAFVKRGTVPALEYIWLPNDHTAGSRPGMLTPLSYVATNDYALAQMVETISRSSIWKSSAIFITEDDAQAGPDHVSAQRTTLFIASPYATGGLHHGHYSTVSVLRTMELILGLKPLSTYDAMALPLYAAFGTTAHLQPYTAVAPRVSLTDRNQRVAYGAAVSARLDFTRPDAANPVLLTNILAHNH